MIEVNVPSPSNNPFRPPFLISISDMISEGEMPPDQCNLLRYRGQLAEGLFLGGS